SVKSSTRRCCSGSPVRLRNGATATAVLGSRQGHCGSDFFVPPDRPAPCLDDNGWSDIRFLHCINLFSLLFARLSRIRVQYGPSLAQNTCKIFDFPDVWYRISRLC